MPRRIPAKDHLLKVAVFVIIGVMGAIEIAVSRGMYADGANMLVMMLDQRAFQLFEHHRITNALLAQAPTMLALNLGVTNLTFLRVLYSGALIFWPLLFWLLALYAVRDDILFWPMVMLFTFVYFNTGFFVISESNLCFALTTCCLACMLRPQPLPKFERRLLIVAAILYPLEYAATIFLGPILCALALWRLDKTKDDRRRRYWAILALLFFAAACTGLWEVLTPRDPTNFASARDYHVLIVDGRFWLLLLYAAVVSAAFFVSSRKYDYVPAFTCLVLILALFFNLLPWWPPYSYYIRMYMTLAMVGYTVALIWFRLWAPKVAATRMPLMRAAIPIFVPFALLALYDVNLSYGYDEYIDHFRAVVNTHQGFVPLEETPLAYDPDEFEFGGTWTHLVMSLAFRDGSDKGIILNAAGYRGYQGFDSSGHIPDLSAYYKNR